jgi:hypothetical protein
MTWPTEPLHRAVDEIAMWLEDQVVRPPVPFRTAPADPLACFGPLPPLPAPPEAPGLWTAPSPWSPEAAPLTVHVSSAGRAARGVAVLVPPWKIRRAWLLSGWRALLQSAGYEVWLVVPPFHLDRTPPGGRSGEGFVGPDLRLLRSAVSQSVLELRTVCALAAARGGLPALVGLSLGGLAAALAATCPEAPPALALVAPALDLHAILTRTPIGRRYRALAAASGAPIPADEEMAPLLRPFDPGARPPAARRVFLATGRQDRVATRRGHLPLVHGWGITPRAYDRGHLTLLFGCRRVRDDLATFLKADQPSRFSPL